MNILFLSFEGEVTSIGHLARRFKAKGHRVFVACCDHFNVTHTRGEIYQYLRSLGLADSEFSNLDVLYRQMNSLPENLSDKEVDWEFLRQFEHTYGKRFTLLELAAMDPLMSGAYHHRNIYYRPRNKALLFKYIELHVKWLQQIFEQLRVDAVFSISYQYFLKAAAFTMADSMRIPFLMLSTCRMPGLLLLYDNFGVGTPEFIREEMRRLEFMNDNCSNATEFINKLIAEPKPVYLDAMDGVREKLPLKTRFRELWRYIYRYPRKAMFIDKHYRGLFRPNYFLPSYFGVLRGMVVSIWRRFAFFQHPNLIKTDLPDGPFVFFPLHIIPESTVLTLSRTFNELECVYQLSKSLPVNWKVVVKPNPGMLGEFDTHPNRYYLEMSRLPNVQFVTPLLPSTSILPKCAAVACISGTALLEAAIYGKPAFRWGRTEFEAIDTIYQFDPQQLQAQLTFPSDSNVKFYIQACFNLSLTLDLALLNYHITSSITPSQQMEFERQLSSIENAILNYLHKNARFVHPTPMTASL